MNFLTHADGAIMPIDYSKWDHMDSSDDESAVQQPQKVPSTKIARAPGQKAQITVDVVSDPN